MDAHKTDAGRIFAIAIEIDALLKDASVVWCNLAQYQCHQKTTYKFLHLRELWSEVPVVWEARKQELVESTFCACIIQVNKCLSQSYIKCSTHHAVLHIQHAALVKLQYTVVVGWETLKRR